jgi:bifunctional DNA-binding transcriptional regulator/antitoxin component of YhaV-PrlF toxin-antitoxin module
MFGQALQQQAGHQPIQIAFMRQDHLWSWQNFHVVNPIAAARVWPAQSQGNSHISGRGIDFFPSAGQHAAFQPLCKIFTTVSRMGNNFRKHNFLPFWHGKFLDMNSIITMDQVGRLILPSPIRKALQVSSPAAFRAEVIGNKVELTLIALESGKALKKRRGLLVVSTGGKKFNAAEAVRIVREGRP